MSHEVPENHTENFLSNVFLNRYFFRWAWVQGVIATIGGTCPVLMVAAFTIPSIDPFETTLGGVILLIAFIGLILGTPAFACFVVSVQALYFRDHRWSGALMGAGLFGPFVLAIATLLASSSGPNFSTEEFWYAGIAALSAWLVGVNQIAMRNGAWPKVLAVFGCIAGVAIPVVAFFPLLQGMITFGFAWVLFIAWLFGLTLVTFAKNQQQASVPAMRLTETS